MSLREKAVEIFREGYKSVSPQVLIHHEISLKDNTLKIGEKTYNLENIDKIIIVGAGKASALMASELETIMGPRITKGTVITKYGFTSPTQIIKIYEAGHPVPDENGFNATSEILDIVKNTGPNDLVIGLFSGGGSALLSDVPEGISIDDIKILNEQLVKCGAGIREINAVRKHLSRIKGGQLAKAIYPGKGISLLLSDVVGDKLDTIASGPMAPDSTTYTNAYNVIQHFDLLDKIPESLLNIIRKGINNEIPETPKNDDPIFVNFDNIVIGSNSLALEAAARQARKMGFVTQIVDPSVTGDAIDVAEFIIETALASKRNESFAKPICLLFGGETTYKVTGNGRGGRNLQMALFAALMLKDNPGIVFLAAGTDGNDGNTEAAGAVADNNTLAEALNLGIDPIQYFRNSDACSFFEKAGGLIVTGPTNTNVMDIYIALIEPNNYDSYLS
jgi:hydroxypyruvate reductase/glycerate 2-kinase